MQEAECVTCGQRITTVEFAMAPRAFWVHVIDPVFVKCQVHEAEPVPGTEHDVIADPRNTEGEPGSY